MEGSPRRGESCSAEGIHFDLTDWNPEPPAGLNFLSLIPFNDGQSVSDPETSQHELQKKAKSHSGRRARRAEFRRGYTVGRDIHDEKRLRQAATADDINLVEDLLDKGVDPCSCDEKRRTALHISAARGNTETVSLLLSGGADPNQKDAVGNTALHLAACTNHLPVVTLLLKAGTDVNQVDQSGRSPLHLALSRLNMLHTYSTSHLLRQEVSQVASMMREYLSVTGQSRSVDELDSLTNRLTTLSTTDELSSVGSLLSDFANMQLQKKQSREGR